jgi:glycosyltransferase involved in cell wall biosynthesis
LCKGGAQENTFHTVRLANRERFDVDLISGPTIGREGSIEDAVRAAGVEIIRAPDLVRNAAPLLDLRTLVFLTCLLRERRYDIVHTHTSKAGFIGRIAARRAGVPIVVHTPHGNIFEGYFSSPVTRLFIAMERCAARRADKIIELTDGGIEEHLAQGIGRREQYVTIFSGIDLAPYESAIMRRLQTRASLGVSPDAFLVGGVGRLEPIKGFAYFVEAARIVARSLPEVRFVVAGDGALASALKEQSADFSDKIQWLGLREDIPYLMAAFDAFVLTSLNEGMGRVLLEAGAAGTPSAASSVGGVPDIIRDGKTGILVPPRDPQAMANAILALARDAALRTSMGRAAREFVVPAFGLDRMTERVETLYEQLIREKRLDA